MMDEKKRLGKGFAVALAVHLIAAVGLGFFGYRLAKTPPEVIEVTLAGGGGGESSDEVEQEEQQEESLFKSFEDIVDNKLKPKPEKKQVIKKKQANNSAPKTASGSAHSGSGNGSAASAGSGSGSGGGSGSGSGNGDGVGEGHGVITQRARLKRDVKPKYPTSAVNKSISGSATVRLVIGADGVPESVTIISSSGNSAIDNSIVDAAYKWRFFPATDKYGANQRDTAKRTIRFDIVK